jgi:hypothetical protein
LIVVILLFLKKDLNHSVMQFLGSGSVSGSGSRRAKMTLESRKYLEMSCFEVLDVLL